MRLLLLAAASLLAGVPVTIAAQPAPPESDPALTEEVRRLVATRVASEARGDSAAYRRLIDPAYAHMRASGFRLSGPTLLRQLPANRPLAAELGDALQHTVTEVHARRLGAVLLTDALVTRRIRVAGVDHISRWREANALVRAGGRWRIAQHSSTPMAALSAYPVAASAIPDSTALADFVGDYEGWPGVVDRITQRGARLFIQAPDRPSEPPYPLVAAGAEAFYPEDDSLGLLVFARDVKGRVTHYITRNEGGPVVVARKIR